MGASWPSRPTFEAPGDSPITMNDIAAAGAGWTTFRRNYAIISVGLRLFFLIPAVKPSLANFSVGLLSPLLQPKVKQ